MPSQRGLADLGGREPPDGAGGDAAGVPPGCLSPSALDKTRGQFSRHEPLSGASGFREGLTQPLSTEGDSWGSRLPCVPSISLLLPSPQCSSILQERFTCSFDLEGLPSEIPLPQ